MKTKQARVVFTQSGKTLRDARKQDIGMLFDVLFDKKKSIEEKNDLLDTVAVFLVENGYYARPVNFNPENSGSLRFVRQGIGSHLHREWRKRKAEQTKKGFIAKGTNSWYSFCSEMGWYPLYGKITDPQS